MKHKETALQHFCSQHNINPYDVLFVFDDVLDFSAAKIAGLRIMVAHSCNPLLIDFAVNNNLVDYITFHDGEDGAIREASELMMQLSGVFDKLLNTGCSLAKLINRIVIKEIILRFFIRSRMIK